ncbi:hypothetical protein C9427_20985 [Mesorhizobium helmanticense]|uniref:Antifreeze protein n=1 Tax=Mesorhizobium helmanticense TaxID=1776423 RepID=A0A2T4IS19_9HYPH|nr:hypothetical protein C9427_20985 [Mesorhizobium helmanticense]
MLQSAKERSMRIALVLLACTCFTVPAAPSFASGCMQVLESDVKIASMRAYAGIMAIAAANGWNYTPESIESGSRRHFEEMSLQLIAVGYEIVPVGAARPQCVVARN